MQYPVKIFSKVCSQSLFTTFVGHFRIKLDFLLFFYFYLMIWYWNQAPCAILTGTGHLKLGAVLKVHVKWSWEHYSFCLFLPEKLQTNIISDLLLLHGQCHVFLFTLFLNFTIWPYEFFWLIFLSLVFLIFYHRHFRLTSHLPGSPPS